MRSFWTLSVLLTGICKTGPKRNGTSLIHMDTSIAVSHQKLRRFDLAGILSDFRRLAAVCKTCKFRLLSDPPLEIGLM